MQLQKRAARIIAQCSVALVSAVLLLVMCRTADAETLRLAVQKTGTFAWELDIIEAEGLDKKAGLSLEVTELASPEATKIALSGGSADMILTDWLWVARQRSLGRRLVFKPYSSAIGAVMIAATSEIDEIADLRGKTIAVAGGPLDKSWLLLRALALREGLDLAKEATILYGAPALLYEKAASGAADASLTYWTYSVALEARGFRRLLGMDEVERRLGAKGPVAMVGYVFDEGLVEKHPGLVERFFEIAGEAKRIFSSSDEAWDKIAPKMGLEDPTRLALYRKAYLDGLPRRGIDEEEADARRLFAILARIGGRDLVGSARELDPGTYYKGPVRRVP